ncbi:MAG: DUF5615 family PIN-like protein [Planctomycetes bacterium]|nr:DUF5615 family PIN-like protein [Planctomycetota bacterium]
MKLLADENLDRPIVQWLRDCNLDVSWMAEREPGADDASIVALSLLEGRALITLDRDFGELVFRRGMNLPGVVYVRFGQKSPDELLAEFQAIWPQVEPRLCGNFVVVSRGRMRVRPLTPA